MLLCSGILYRYQTWKKWAIQCNTFALPADPGVFALYLVHLIQQGSSVSLLNSVIYGASWVHKKSSYPELGNHPLVQQVAEAGRRILAKPLNHKKTLVISRLGQGDLGDVQVAALFALGFFGFLCWDELSRLAINKLFTDTRLAMFLMQRKSNSFVMVLGFS